MGSFLIISGDKEARKPYENTKVTSIVDSIRELEQRFLKEDVTILDNIKKVSTGWNMRVQHGDGLVVEYVELANNRENNK